MFKCKICNIELDLDKCQKFISNCIVNKCELVRYQCTNCGVVFGTVDMISNSPEQMKKAYEFCDSVWKEADGFAFERETFFSIKPQTGMDKIYLNYGSGNTCSTIITLRRLGYNIIGFEPYLPVSNDPNVITSRDELVKYKFDGIVSNNLIEHLNDPIEELMFINGLLKNKNCLQAHSSACYEYRYAHSAYHLFFFLGQSVNFLCKNVGLKVEKYYKKIISGEEYINYVFKQI